MRRKRSLHALVVFSLLAALLAGRTDAAAQDRVSASVGAGPILRGLEGDVRGGHGFAGLALSLTPVLSLRGSATVTVGRLSPGEVGVPNPVESHLSTEIGALLRWPSEGMHPYLLLGVEYGRPGVSNAPKLAAGFGRSVGLGLATSNDRGWFIEIASRQMPMVTFTLGRIW